jgi:hypothetical protein
MDKTSRFGDHVTEFQTEEDRSFLRLVPRKLERFRPHSHQWITCTEAREWVGNAAMQESTV